MAPCTALCLRRSNVIAINTPATQSFGGSITMEYDYNRLMNKRMPNSTGTDLYDVDYTYGSYNDGRNGAGRIVSITQGGSFKSDYFRYDELGQRVEEEVSIDVPMHGVRNFTTQKFFDSFGRILQAVYPDGDQVDYDYNSLGELNTIKSKVAGVTQDIVSAISYNGYGQISQMTYGNGTTTSYSCASGNPNKATTLMGSTVNAKEQGTSAFTPVLSRTYAYNKQGMVAQMNRTVAGSLLAQASNASFSDAYTYDRFGRLEAYEQSKGATSIYSLDMQYNQAGGITFKNSNGSGFMNASALTYNLEYTYVGKKYHQLDQVWDPTNGILTKFTYNTSGSVTQIDDSSQPVAQDFFWNEQQQLTGVSNQQGVHHYVYDHSGERIMKSSLINSTVYLNDQVIDSASNLDPYTVYVNPFYVVTGFQGGDRVSKHYYMNQQRVATDITINYDPSSKGGGQQEEQAKGSSAKEKAWSPALTDFNEVLVGLGQKPLDTASLELPTLAAYFPETATSKSSNSQAENASTTPRILFWYHPDYLGNVDLITERDGYAHEFFMYNPWGEEMHQWNANTYAFTSPYRFNAKELDPETGLAYYGARYYQNKLGVWLSVDPLAHERESLTPYNFVSNNSMHRVDPDGALDDWVQNIGTGGYEWKDNVTFANNTPEGYKYVGSRDADILKDLGVSYSFPEQSSNRIGYVAADVDMGKYAVNHLINVKVKSNVSISADVRYYLLDGTENNRFGKKFEGIKVFATVIGSNSDADGTVNAYSNLTVGYGGKTYSAGMKEPQLPYLKQTGTSVAVGSVNIPSSCLSRSNSFSGVRVSGGWWVTNTANMRTPVVNHPLIPTPQTFRHSWTFAKR